MILTIFRPKRIKDGKPHVSRSYRGRYRLYEGDKLTDVPLHTTDKRVARERLELIVREKQLEAVGVLSRTAPLCKQRYKGICQTIWPISKPSVETASIFSI